MPRAEGDRVDAMLRWTDELAGGATPTHQLFSDGGRPPILAVTYSDAPWPGWTLGLTYGASLVWPSGVELVTVVKDPSPRWTWAVADFVDRHRADGVGAGPGDTINWREPIADGSPMDALVICGPRSLHPDAHVVHLDEDDHVSLLQVVPVHAQELPLVRDVGVERFMDRLGEAAFDPQRPLTT